MPTRFRVLALISVAFYLSGCYLVLSAFCWAYVTSEHKIRKMFRNSRLMSHHKEVYVLRLNTCISLPTKHALTLSYGNYAYFVIKASLDSKSSGIVRNPIVLDLWRWFECCNFLDLKIQMTKRRWSWINARINTRRTSQN